MSAQSAGKEVAEAERLCGPVNPNHVFLVDSHGRPAVLQVQLVVYGEMQQIFVSPLFDSRQQLQDKELEVKFAGNLFDAANVSVLSEELGQESVGEVNQHQHLKDKGRVGNHGGEVLWIQPQPSRARSPGAFGERFRH